MDKMNSESLSEDTISLISRLGLTELVSQLSGWAKTEWELSDKAFNGIITEAEQKKFDDAKEKYDVLESKLRKKFSEHMLSDNQTAGIMDYIWTNWLGKEQ